MKERKLTTPQLMLVAATRALLGVGIGLLAAGYVNETQRLSIGWTLTIVGAVLTIPLLWEIFGQSQ